MNRMLNGALCVPLLVLALSGCDNGARALLIETYRAASFSSSRSEVSGSGVRLTTSFDLGYAYEVTSRRLEYAPVPVDSAPPIDERGELVRPSFANAADPTHHLSDSCRSRRLWSGRRARRFAVTPVRRHECGGHSHVS